MSVTLKRPNAVAPQVTRGGALRGPLQVAVVAASVMLVVSLVDPNEPGHFATCPFLALTGHWCPGCGTLRALYALGHGDVLTALARNPFSVLALGYGVGAWLLWTRRRWLGRSRHWVAPAWTFRVVLALVLVFWVVRNLPGMTWLSPA